MYNLLAGEYPFPDDNAIKLGSFRFTSPCWINPEYAPAVQFIKSALNPNPVIRPSAVEVGVNFW